MKKEKKETKEKVEKGFAKMCISSKRDDEYANCEIVGSGKDLLNLFTTLTFGLKKVLMSYVPISMFEEGLESCDDALTIAFKHGLNPNDDFDETIERFKNDLKEMIDELDKMGD